jgi:hypothetical protein
MRIPLTRDMYINDFSGATVTEFESLITNGMIEAKGERAYLTQRPSFDVFEDAGTHISDARGRAIIYWDETSGLYILNNGTLYKNSQSNSISTSPAAGTQKCKFLILGSVLILLDAENDQGFTISNSDAVAEITDTDFPPKQTPPIPLAHGGAVLDKYLFVLGTDGIIYNSAINDASAWSALDFREAERDPDAGVYIGKHHDNIVVYGVSTIEFFYDAANTTGSPLSRRQDVAYNTGCATGESVWEEGDRSFFIGTNFSGAIGIYTLENFQIRKVSTSTFDSYLTNAITKEGFSATGSGTSAQGHIFYMLTIYSTPSDISPVITFVYDDTTGVWGEWETSINGISKFPLMSWTKRQGAIQRFGEGILSNGDLISINDNLNTQDTLAASTYVPDDYVAIGYVEATGESGTPIDMITRTGMEDAGTNNYKYLNNLRFVGDKTPNSQTLTVKWADDNSSSFNAGRTTDTSKYKRLTRLGRSRRRNHQIEYSGTDKVLLESLELDVSAGNY